MEQKTGIYKITNPKNKIKTTRLQYRKHRI